jgi:hypothetical protein
VLEYVHELLGLARRHGYRPDELIELIRKLA